MKNNFAPFGRKPKFPCMEYHKPVRVALKVFPLRIGTMGWEDAGGEIPPAIAMALPVNQTVHGGDGAIFAAHLLSCHRRHPAIL